MQVIKNVLFILITLLAGCYDNNFVSKEKYTKQITVIGIISDVPDPNVDIPDNHPPFVYCLISVSDTYILTLDSQTIDKLIVKDFKYSIGEIVTITGTTRVKQGSFLEEYTELEIETIEKIGELNQDIQRFLGTYAIEIVCNTTMRGSIILSEEKENHILFFSIIGYVHVEGIYTYVSGDSLFIPFQWYWYFPSGSMGSFTGKGKMKNDSIFFNIVYGSYGYDFSVINFINCDCKGKKWETVNEY